MHQRFGASYHCVHKLYLPVFDGVQEALEWDNEARKKDLAWAKTSPAKKKNSLEKTKGY